MSIFRRYKTTKELLPGFLLEKEIGIQRKTCRSYTGQLPIFTDWLEDNGSGKILKDASGKYLIVQ